ncbi:hypothetical protein CyaNS01_02880 [Cyanobium sp. NS01]|nr:hypothetical protein CyaNS01_02880 [Cyanobium sp. NS01]
MCSSAEALISRFASQLRVTRASASPAARQHKEGLLHFDQFPLDLTHYRPGALGRG